MPVLSDEQILLRDTVRGFVAEKIAPQAEGLDHSDALPEALLAEMGEMGLFGIPLSDADGGAGLDMRTTALVVEELARGAPALAWAVAAHTVYALRPIALFGNAAQKERCLPSLASGGEFGALAAGEPHGDWLCPRAKIEGRADGQYQIRGRKGLVTLGGRARWLLVAGDEGGKESVFIVDSQKGGVVPESAAPKLGLRGIPVVYLNLDVTVEADDRVQGGSVLVKRARDEGRILAAAVCLGIIEECLARSAQYAKGRQAFRKPISDFQEIRAKLADMKLAADATRALIDRALDLGEIGHDDFSAAAASAKLFAAPRAVQAGKEAVQIHGGNGYTSEYAVERFFRDAMVLELIGGPAQAQRALLAEACLAV